MMLFQFLLVSPAIISSYAAISLTLTNVINARGLYSDVRKFRDVLIAMSGWCNIQIQRDGYAMTEVYTHSPPHTETVLDPSCEWEAFQSPVNNHVYIYQLDPVDHRLRIFDMGLETTISTAITKVADLAGYNSYKLVVDYYHTVAFFVGPNFADIMDLSNPIAPTLIARVTTGVNAVQSIFLYKNHLYISGTDAGLRRINLHSATYSLQTVVAAAAGTSFVQVAVSDSLIVANGQESNVAKSMIIDANNFAVYSSSPGLFKGVSFLNDTRIIRAANVPPQAFYDFGLDIHDLSNRVNPVLVARTSFGINFCYVPKFYQMASILYVPNYWGVDFMSFPAYHPTAATEFAAEHSNNIGYFENPLVVSGTLSAQVSSSGNFVALTPAMLSIFDRRAQYAFAIITITLTSNSISSNIVQKQVNSIWTAVSVGSSFTQKMVTDGQIRILITDNGPITFSALQLGGSISSIIFQVSLPATSSSVLTSSSLIFRLPSTSVVVSRTSTAVYSSKYSQLDSASSVVDDLASLSEWASSEDGAIRLNTKKSSSLRWSSRTTRVKSGVTGEKQSFLSGIVLRAKLNLGYFVGFGSFFLVILGVVLITGSYRRNQKLTKGHSSATANTDNGSRINTLGYGSGTVFSSSSATTDSGNRPTAEMGNTTMSTTSVSTKYTLFDVENTGLALPGYMEYTDGLHYRRLESIAVGGMGAIFLAQPLHPKLGPFNRVIVKVLNENVVSREMFHQEVAIMASLMQYRNFGQLLGYSETPMSIVMKYYSHGDLKSFILSHRHKKSKLMLSHCLCDISVGLMIMHGKGFVHSDIKPENILLERAADGRIYCAISDFGITKIVSQKSLMVREFHPVDINGRSLHYCPPEILSRTYTPAALQSLADVYSFGILFSFVLNRLKPWAK